MPARIRQIDYLRTLACRASLPLTRTEIVARPLARHAIALAVLTLVALPTLGAVVAIRPVDTDNLSPLSWAARAGPASFIWGQPESYPEWRPLTFLTLWAQYQVAGIEHVESWFAVNLALWIACAYLVYLFAERMTSSLTVSLLVALAMLLDLRAVEGPVNWITGRQITLGCIFGFLALLIATRTPMQRTTLLRPSAVFLLLLLGPFFKEYALAFPGALLVWLALWRPADWKALGIAAIAAPLTYLAIRLMIVGLSTGGYCNEMGFFTTTRVVCYRDLDPAGRLGQQAYNVGSTFLAILLPGLFTGGGALSPRGPLLAASTAGVLAVVGWLRMPRQTLAMLAVIAFVALVSFAVHRDRNQVYGTMALYISAGAGLASIASWAGRRALTQFAFAIGVALSVWWLADRAAQLDRRVDAHVARTQTTDPCPKLQGSRYERAVIVRLKHKYGMPDPDCAGWP